MRPIYQRSACLLCAAAAALILSGCGRNHAPAEQAAAVPTAAVTAPTVATTEDPALTQEELTAVLEENQLYTLSRYPSLKRLDLSGSTCYSAILQYIQDHPEVAVTYTVDLGGTQVRNDTESITLTPDAFDYSALLENLQYLPAVSGITFPELSLDAAQLAALREAYPQIALDYTIELFGNTYGPDTDTLDLSYMESSRVEEAAGKLGLLPNLTSVKLSNSLSMEQVARLQDSNPGAVFEYSFYLFNQTLSTTTETVEFKNLNIGDEGEGKIRQALDILDSCSRFVLDNCKVSFEILAAIREDYREKTNVVWRVNFGDNYRYTAMTDDEMIRAVYHVSDENVTPLKYCEGAKYIDMGHNEYLTDLSFVSGMPNLEAFIGSGSAVKELTGFENCKKLYWLELANCLALTNIDALAGCESLGYLNISYCKATSYMALDGLPLERFICLNPRASTEEQNTFLSIHPGCRVVYYGYSNPFTPWRYDDNGKTYNQYYKEVIRQVFNLDYLEQFLPKDDS